MNRIELADLRRMLGRCAGIDGAAEVDETTVDIPFDDLGYDSLALLQLARIVEDDTGLRVPDDALESMRTPGTTIDYVNARLAAA